MNLRAFVIGSIVVLATVGGILWFQHDSCSQPDGVVVDTHYSQDSVLSESGLAAVQSLSGEEDRHLLVSGESEAHRNLANDTQASGFSLETDFESSYVVLVQTESSSTPRLELDCLQRTPGGIDLTLSLTNATGPRTDDLVTHSLLVRITDRQNPSPGNISVQVTGHDVSPSFQLPIQVT